ncbi:hypothetical protein CEP54_002994 [Fusarium duplospermum]|uniref:BZIP domain-containing protein n=1 Tax=Fusarium duplospermum TaxID=1325734 RepID=A0A428QRN0_9HYPO|nr:hypothetical protein CEP54_002994 [Fusarium duplospermum]
MSVLESESGLSEQALLDADDNNATTQLLAETIDRRKAKNRIAQRKHRQKLKERIEELELQLEYANSNSRPMVQRMPPHPMSMTPVSHSNTTEGNALSHMDHIEDLFSSSRGQLESVRNSQEYNLLFGVSPPFSHLETSSLGAELSPLQTRDLTTDGEAQDNTVTRGFSCILAPEALEPPTSSLLTTSIPRANENEKTQPIPTANRRPSLHPNSDLQDLDDPADPPCSWTMERKVAYLVDCSKALGFRDFDSVIMSFYTNSFDIMSKAHNMQRVSRIRGLASVLRTIDASAEAWPPHESHGYRAEIFKAAEHLYKAELQRAIDSGALMALEERVNEDITDPVAVVRLTSHKSEILSQVCAN